MYLSSGQKKQRLHYSNLLTREFLSASRKALENLFSLAFLRLHLFLDWLSFSLHYSHSKWHTRALCSEKCLDKSIISLIPQSWCITRVRTSNAELVSEKINLLISKNNTKLSNRTFFFSTSWDFPLCVDTKGLTLHSLFPPPTRSSLFFLYFFLFLHRIEEQRKKVVRDFTLKNRTRTKFSSSCTKSDRMLVSKASRARLIWFLFENFWVVAERCATFNTASKHWCFVAQFPLLNVLFMFWYSIENNEQQQRRRGIVAEIEGMRWMAVKRMKKNKPLSRIMEL